MVPLEEDLTILPKSDPHSPFNSRIPDSTAQTEVLSKRFELWRQIIKSLITYYKAVVISTQQFSVINTNVANSFNFPFLTNVNTAYAATTHTLDIVEPSADNIKKQSFFSKFGSGSIQDVQILLKKYHLNLAEHQKQMGANLATVIIPKLEELQKDLVVKVKEIKSLTQDFKGNTIKAEIALTGQLLNDYIESMKKLNEKGDCTKDPYLYRLKLELQLKQQLHVENYLEEAFMNLQVTSLMLEKIIYKEIQHSLNKYSELISQEIFIHYNDLINELHQGIISKKPQFEWDDFITRDNGKTLLKLKHDDTLPLPKKVNDLVYPFNRSIMSKTIRSGYLMKKSKLLKTYSKSFFILTLNYLHEFKHSKLDGSNITPVHSIKLNDCILVDHNESKFQLKVVTKSFELKKSTTVNYVFKNVDLSEQEFQKWIHDLRTLTCFNTFRERFEYIKTKSMKQHMSKTSSSLLPTLSNNPSYSRAQTPRFEIDNPMDLAVINSKLESIQMGGNYADISTEHSFTTTSPQTAKIIAPPTKGAPPITNQPQQVFDRQNPPKLTLDTKPSQLTPPVPSLTIQRPTPTRPIAPRLPSQSSIHSGHSTTSSNGGSSLPTSPTHFKENQSSESLINLPRSATPMIGQAPYHQTNNKSEHSNNPEDLIQKIQLNESLYDEQGHQVDLSALLKQMQ